MLTKAWLGMVEYEPEEYGEELLGEEGAYEANEESAAESDEQEACILMEELVWAQVGFLEDMIRFVNVTRIYGIEY